MNEIIKSHVDALGYDFIPKKYLPKGKDEYWLRNKQNQNGIVYRQLTTFEIESLVRNRNTSDNWNRILVSDAFSPELVENCKFFGLVRIGKLEPYYLEFHNLRRPVGLYNSTIISSDFGNNVCIDNVNYLSHYIVGNDVMIVNTNELTTSDHSKFGNGILKEGEPEFIRIRLEVCNENGGRSIIPFDGMLPGDLGQTLEYLPKEEFEKATAQERARVYLSARDERVLQPPEDADAAWVAAHASYKYLGDPQVSVQEMRLRAGFCLLHAPLNEELTMMQYNFDKAIRVVPVAISFGGVWPYNAERFQEQIDQAREQVRKIRAHEKDE